MGALNIGSDGAGSIRIPAAFCGVYGLKATFGRVPTYPTGRMQGISHVGPIVRSVADAALMMTVIARPDWRDWQCLPDDGRDYRIGLEDGVRGLKIAYSRTLGYARREAEVVACVDQAVRVLAELGAIVSEVDPGFAEPRAAFDVIWNANLQSIVAALPESKVALMDQAYVCAAREAPAYSAEDVFVAGMARATLARHMARFHLDHDLLVTPALPLAAFDVGMDVPAGSGMRSWMDWNPYLYPFNWTQQPAASMPCGFTSSGLPVAMQIVGPRHADSLVLRASRAYESGRPIALPTL